MQKATTARPFLRWKTCMDACIDGSDHAEGVENHLVVQKLQPRTEASILEHLVPIMQRFLALSTVDLPLQRSDSADARIGEG